jgi:N-acetylglucosaminyldiphosphoundecaprenol N-acetyl-beta-D-mannosaminyltransferase
MPKVGTRNSERAGESLALQPPENKSSSFRVLGVRIQPIQIPQVIEAMESWIAEGSGSRYIAVTGMHGIAESLRNPQLRESLNAADLVVPDGMPLVWLGRWHGYGLKRRVYGPELMETFCRTTGSRYRHFFYGGAAGVAQRLAEVESSRHGIQVAGTFTPPFRPLTVSEQGNIVRLINSASADILWVGLSTPKQEQWMYEYSQKLQAPVIVGVGAAFDFHTGRLRQAPVWMREHGLEWLYRLWREPRRLWRRYLVYGAQFAWNVSLELLKIKQFN